MASSSSSKGGATKARGKTNRTLGVYAFQPTAVKETFYLGRFVDCIPPTDGLRPSPDLQIERPEDAPRRRSGRRGASGQQKNSSSSPSAAAAAATGNGGGRKDSGGTDDFDLHAHHWRLRGQGGRSYIGREISYREKQTQPMLLSLENAGTPQPYFICRPVKIVEFLRDTRDFQNSAVPASSAAQTRGASRLNRPSQKHRGLRDPVSRPAAEGSTEALTTFLKTLVEDNRREERAARRGTRRGGGGGGGGGGSEFNPFGALGEVDYNAVFSDDEELDYGAQEPHLDDFKDAGYDDDEAEEYMDDSRNDLQDTITQQQQQPTQHSKPQQLDGGRLSEFRSAAGERDEADDDDDDDDEEDVSDIDLSDIDEDALEDEIPKLPPQAPITQITQSSRKRSHSHNTAPGPTKRPKLDHGSSATTTDPLELEVLDFARRHGGKPIRLDDFVEHFRIPSAPPQRKAQLSEIVKKFFRLEGGQVLVLK